MERRTGEVRGGHLGWRKKGINHKTIFLRFCKYTFALALS